MLSCRGDAGNGLHRDQHPCLGIRLDPASPFTPLYILRDQSIEIACFSMACLLANRANNHLTHHNI